jgi:NADH pyrophosphatase NudC (nudix superfamily)
MRECRTCGDAGRKDRSGMKGTDPIILCPLCGHTVPPRAAPVEVLIANGLACRYPRREEGFPWEEADAK